MITLDYLSIDCNNEIVLRKGSGVLFDSEILLDLSNINYWKALLRSRNVDISNKSYLNPHILIPYHNSNSLKPLLLNLKNDQILPKSCILTVTIVASACIPLYLDAAYKLKKDLESENFSIQIIEQPLPGKPTALNTGISAINSDYIIQLVDDILPSKYTVAITWLSLYCFPEYGASAIVSEPANLDNSNLLMKVQRLHHDLFYKNDQYALVGRAFCFNKKFVQSLGGFPEHIMSEDFWLEMHVKHLTKGFIILDNVKVLYTKPKTWYDYLKQIDRFDGSFKQLKIVYPEMFFKVYGNIKNTFSTMLGIKNFWHFGDFIFNKNYEWRVKIIYIFVIIYQLYYLSIKNYFFKVKSASFKRELSTID